MRVERSAMKMTRSGKGRRSVAALYAFAVLAGGTLSGGAQARSGGGPETIWEYLETSAQLPPIARNRPGSQAQKTREEWLRMGCENYAQWVGGEMSIYFAEVSETQNDGPTLHAEVPNNTLFASDIMDQMRVLCGDSLVVSRATTPQSATFVVNANLGPGSWAVTKHGELSITGSWMVVWAVQGEPGGTHGFTTMGHSSSDTPPVRGKLAAVPLLAHLVGRAEEKRAEEKRAEDRRPKFVAQKSKYRATRSPPLSVEPVSRPACVPFAPFVPARRPLNVRVRLSDGKKATVEPRVLLGLVREKMAPYCNNRAVLQWSTSAGRTDLNIEGRVVPKTPLALQRPGVKQRFAVTWTITRPKSERTNHIHDARMMALGEGDARYEAAIERLAKVLFPSGAAAEP